MLSLLIIISLIAIIDSTSMIPIALLPLAVFLGGERPILRGNAFIFGMFVTYWLAGVGLFFGFEWLFEVIGPSVSRWWNAPNTLELILQLLIGLALIIYTFYLNRSQSRKRIRKESKKEETTTNTTQASPLQAFILGVTLIVIGLPGAIPYFGGVEQILRAEQSFAFSMLILLVYNVIFVLPFIIMVIIRVLFAEKSERLLTRVSLFSQVWGRRIMVVSMALLGIALCVDAVSWFFGYPLFPVNVAI